MSVLRKHIHTVATELAFMTYLPNALEEIDEVPLHPFLKMYRHCVTRATEVDEFAVII